MNYELLRDFVAAYPAQPATAFWRAIEIDALRKEDMPDGLGIDVGCGDGKLTKIILEHTGHRRLVGVDLDPFETAAAEASGLYEAVHTCPADDIPCADNMFDFAISNSVLEHIPDIEAVVAEVGRILKPGGSLLITVPTAGFLSNLAGPLLWGKNRPAYLEQIDRRLAHHHYLDTDQWRAMLDRCNFDLERRFGYLDRRECRRWESLSRMTGGLLYSLTGGRARPITIQRNLGMREAQNRFSWPGPVARLIASVCAVGHSRYRDYWSVNTGLEDKEAGCLLIVARRR